MLGDLAVRSVKTGMLATRAIVDVVADLAAGRRLPHLVVDPVLVSSSGHPLMDPDGIEAYLTRLIPHAVVVTPNLREAAALTHRPVEDLLSVAAMAAAAEQIRSRGATYVVVKGGHLTDVAHDVVAGPEGITVLEATRIDTRQRPRHGLLPLGRHRRQPGPRGGRAHRHRAGPRHSWPGGWPGVPRGRWEPGTGPSTISGGLRRRRLESWSPVPDRHPRSRRRGGSPRRPRLPRRPGPAHRRTARRPTPVSACARP